MDFPRSNGTSMGLLVNATWQRRLKSLWEWVTGRRTAATLNFPSTADGDASDNTVTVPGAAIGDFVQLGLSPDAVIVGTIWVGFVSAAGVVTVRFCNFSGAPVNPPADTRFQILVTPQ